ncbi:hypothetical protein R1sor_018221 [Riccia sorocarpa]|uniref:Uncharacterized protein n=1 Tax=Riccia sorocarpa TaxID=122646 RepID=A0ABD3ICC8_9MARC
MDVTKKPEDPADVNSDQGRPYAMNDLRDSGTLRILAAHVSKMEGMPQAREVTGIQKTSRSIGTTGRTILRSHSWYRARDEDSKLRIDRGKRVSDRLPVDRGEGLKVIRTTGEANRKLKKCGDRVDWDRTDWREAVSQCKEIQSRLDQLHSLEATVNRRLSDSTLFVAPKMAPRKPASRAISQDRTPAEEEKLTMLAEYVLAEKSIIDKKTQGLPVGIKDGDTGKTPDKKSSTPDRRRKPEGTKNSEPVGVKPVTEWVRKPEIKKASDLFKTASNGSKPVADSPSNRTRGAKRKAEEPSNTEGPHRRRKLQLPSDVDDESTEETTGETLGSDEETTASSDSGDGTEQSTPTHK